MLDKLQIEKELKILDNNFQFLTTEEHKKREDLQNQLDDINNG